MQEGEQFERLMQMSEIELLTEYLAILLRPGFELSERDRDDIRQIDMVTSIRGKAARA
jgi:hypothetical protein